MSKYFQVFISMAIYTICCSTSLAETAIVDSANDQDPYVYVERTKMVMDTIATRDFIEKELAALNEQKSEFSNETLALQSQKDSVGKYLSGLSSEENLYKEKIREIASFTQSFPHENKIKDKSQKDILVGFFDAVVVGENPNIIRADSAVSTIYLSKTALEKIAIDSNKKKIDLKDIRKDAGKGKLTIPVVSCLEAMTFIYADLCHQVMEKYSDANRYLQSLDKQIWDVNTNIKSLSRKIDYVSSTDNYERAVYELTGSSNYPRKEITVKEKVKNKYYRPFGEDNTQANLILQTEGWEWASEKLEKKQVYYPSPISYEFHPKYPQYRILNGCAYDSIGNLKRVLYCNDESKIIDKLEKKYINDQIIKDYKNNKYGILSKPRDVQYALKNILGLSSEHDKRISSIDLDNKVVDIVRNSNGKSKKAARNDAKKVLGLFFARELERGRLDNKDAKNFITQCEEDHKGEFGKLWKVDRVNDTTFQIVVYSEKQGKERKYTIKYFAKEPFGMPEYKYE